MQTSMSSRSLAQLYALIPGSLDLIGRTAAGVGQSTRPAEPISRSAAPVPPLTEPRSSLPADVLRPLLIAVRDNAGMSQRAIARAVGRPKSTVARDLAALERDGLIERSAEGFALTPAGQHLADS